MKNFNEKILANYEVYLDEYIHDKYVQYCDSRTKTPKQDSWKEYDNDPYFRSYILQEYMESLWDELESDIEERYTKNK